MLRGSDSLCKLLLIVFSCTVSLSSSSADVSSCHYETEQSSNAMAVDCSNRDLTTLPNLPSKETIGSLDLSRNGFTSLGSIAFHGMITMRKLNISSCNIQHIANSSFDGLDNLTILDMKNNPVIKKGLPEGIFDRLPRLETLYISGYVMPKNDMKHWGKLAALKEIFLTPTKDFTNDRLTDLENLIKVYFVFCESYSTLSSKILHPFRESKVKEMAFIACGIDHIENGTFTDLNSLSVLNLAGNTELQIDNVITALSTSANVNVSTLILDCVGSRNSLFIAGLHERPSCRSALRNIRRLSLRGTNVVAVTGRFRSCLPNLEAITFGFNTIAKCGRNSHDCIDILLETLTHVKYIDMSYFMVSDTPGLGIMSGYSTKQNWVKANDDYFPNLADYISVPCSQQTNNVSRSGCDHVFFPPCLTYFKGDHWFRNLFTSVSKQSRCVDFTNSSLAYLNVSGRYSSSEDTIALYMPVYGLTSLQIVDVSKFGLSAMNWAVFSNKSVLRILILSGNKFGEKQLFPVPVIPNLIKLDLASNVISSFPEDMFVNLASLQILDISNNQLKTVDFKLPSSLKYLDISGNLLTSFESNSQLMLDARPDCELNVNNNPLQCDCPEVNFIKWFQVKSRSIRDHERLTCQQGTRTRRIKDIDVSYLSLKCGITVNTVVISTTVCSLIVLFTVGATILYRYRWFIRWRYYKLRYLRQRRNEDMLLGHLNHELQYSAYVIYPFEDDTMRDWVTNTLRIEVENTLEKPPLFIKGRDDTIGVSLIDEIVRGIMLSQTAIWIVCPEFFQDNSCETAANFAFHHLGLKNNLLVIMENRFQRYTIPRAFHNLFHSNVGLARIRLTENPDSQSLFWAKLNNFLPAWAATPYY